MKLVLFSQYLNNQVIQGKCKNHNIMRKINTCMNKIMQYFKSFKDIHVCLFSEDILLVHKIKKVLFH